jgi:hypothetical protein
MKANARKLVLLAGSLSVLLFGQVRAELIYATTGFDIARFDSASANVVTSVTITGMQFGETLVGIDLRPSDGLLYGIGSMNRLYTINPLSGLAMQVGTAGAFTLGGTAFGIDFNPVPDRLRLVSNTEQNLRINPNDGTLTATDPALNPAGNVVAVAYSNNFAGALSTTLYAIDSVSGMLSIISVPNSGGPINPVGSLGLGTNLGESIGFDISGLTGVAYAYILTDGLPRLYTINLATGTATLVGIIGNGETQYVGLTAGTAVPEPSSILLLGVGAGLFAGYRRYRRTKS